MASAEAVARRRANRAARRAAKAQQRVVHEDCGGTLSIPVDWDTYLWPERQQKPKPFELSRAKFLYIKQREKQPWIARAYTEAFWQCRTCGWQPWPVPVVFCGAQLVVNGVAITDDDTWEWFNELRPKSREMLVTLTRKINADERELRSQKPMKDVSTTVDWDQIDAEIDREMANELAVARLLEITETKRQVIE